MMELVDLETTAGKRMPELIALDPLHGYNPMDMGRFLLSES